jgi:hypothetical protein
MSEVLLSHRPNPDLAGGYWSPPVDKCQWVPVETIESAVQACREFIKRNNLGGGNWSGGLFRTNGVVISRVAYNGRVFPGESND